MAVSSTSVLVLMAILCAVDIRVQAALCPPFWTYYGGSCYRYFGERVDWADAEANCARYFTSEGQAHLASVHDDDENSFLFKLFVYSIGETPVYRRIQPGPPHPRVYGIWLGLRQITNGGIWTYTDGTPYDYRAWKAGQPDDAGSHEDCVHMWRWNAAEDNVENRWNDIVCEGRPMEYVCKAPANTA